MVLMEVKVQFITKSSESERCLVQCLAKGIFKIEFLLHRQAINRVKIGVSAA